MSAAIGLAFPVIVIALGSASLGFMFGARWMRNVEWPYWSGESRRTRQAILNGAADKLDAQATEHGEVVNDYTDLLRVWADDEKRWEAGA